MRRLCKGMGAARRKAWNSTKHRDTHTQYYRDTEEGKREFGCSGNCAYCASHAAEASDSEKKTD